MFLSCYIWPVRWPAIIKMYLTICVKDPLNRTNKRKGCHSGSCNLNHRRKLMFCFIPPWLPAAVNRMSLCTPCRWRSCINKVMCVACWLRAWLAAHLGLVVCLVCVCEIGPLDVLIHVLWPIHSSSSHFLTWLPISVDIDAGAQGNELYCLGAGHFRKALSDPCINCNILPPTKAASGESVVCGDDPQSCGAAGAQGPSQ